MAAVSVHPMLVVPVLVLAASVAILPLLIAVLVLVAVCSSEPGRDRRRTAEKILDRLLATVPGGKQSPAEPH